MSRHVVAGILGLALAGCAQDRPAVSRSRPTLPPVALTPPMSSIHEAINRENPQVDPGSVRAGRPAEVAGVAPPPSPVASWGPVALGGGRPAPFAGQSPETPRPRAGQAPEAAGDAATLVGTSPAAGGAEGPQPPLVPQELPADAPASAPAPAPAERVRIELPGASPGAEPVSASTRPAEPARRPSAPVRDPLLGPDPDIMPSMDILPAAPPKPASTPEAPASLPPSPEPPAAGTPAEPAPPPAEIPAAPGGRPTLPVDPLLGPDPDIMPMGGAPVPVPDPGAAASKLGRPSPAAAQAVEPLPVPETPANAPEPPPEPASALPPAATAPAVPKEGDDEPLPTLATPIEVPKGPAPGPPSSAVDRSPPGPPATIDALPDPGTSRPAPPKAADPLDGPVELPPLSSPAPTDPGGSTTAAPRPRAPLAAGPGVLIRASSDPLKDPQVKPASVPDPTSVRSKITTRSLFEAGKPAARVGDEVITLHELKVAVAQRRRGMPADRTLSAEERYVLARSVLNELIDRKVVIQEAKRVLKDAKRVQMLMDVADRVWVEEELPPLLRQTASANIYEVKKKLADRGESLDDLREQYRQEFLSRGFLEQKLSPKMQVDLPEMREYYLAHLKSFDRPAQVTWREVLVEAGKHKTRAEARRRADALLARLRRGDDFAAVARAESDGPNKADGGRWQTAPGGYAVPAVSAALDTLPVGQVSPVIEGPNSFHIVRVEARRQAGAATFAEVQGQIRRSLRQEKVQREWGAYLDKLRRQTVVTTVFDNPPAPRPPAAGR